MLCIGRRTSACAFAAVVGSEYRSSSTGRITGERLTLALVLATLLCSSAAAQGIITTVAGGGPTKISARSVSLEPYGVAVDSTGNVLIASPEGIFSVDPSGQLTTVGDGCGHAVCRALALAVANTGTIYTADLGNNRVLKIDRNGSSATVGATTQARMPRHARVGCGGR